MRKPVPIRLMLLPARLKAIMDLVPEGCRLADIGCDHGKLPIALVQAKRIRKAIASDIAEGPLEMARENLEKYKAGAYIELRQSNGFSAYQPGEADCAVIAGMGGHEIRQILDQAPEGVLENMQTLILQPQTEPEQVRYALHEHGFQIENERFIMDRGKWYTILLATPGEERYEDPMEYVYGRVLIRRRDPDYLSFLERRSQALRTWAEASADPSEALKLREEAEWIQQSISITN